MLSRRFGDMALPVSHALEYPSLPWPRFAPLHTTNSGVCPGKIRLGQLFWKVSGMEAVSGFAILELQLECCGSKVSLCSRAVTPRLDPSFPCDWMEIPSEDCRTVWCQNFASTLSTW